MGDNKKMQELRELAVEMKDKVEHCFKKLMDESSEFNSRLYDAYLDERGTIRGREASKADIRRLHGSPVSGTWRSLNKCTDAMYTAMAELDRLQNALAEGEEIAASRAEDEKKQKTTQ